MSVQRTLARIAVVAGALVSMWALAVPAQAANPVSVNIGNLPSSFKAGEARGFTVNVSNRSRRQGYPHVTISVLIQLPGLTADQVRMVRTPGGNQLRTEPAGSGVVRAVDDSNLNVLLPRRTLRAGYQLQFAAGTPSGKAEMAVEVRAGGNLLARSGVRGFTVAGTAVAPTPTAQPTTQPTQAPTATVNPTAAQPADEPPPPSAASASANGGTGLSWAWYLLGALLIGAGGVVVWRMLRQPSNDPAGEIPPDGGYQPGVYHREHPPATRHSTLDQPTAPYPTISQPPPPITPPGSGPPTTVMPAVDPYQGPIHRHDPDQTRVSDPPAYPGRAPQPPGRPTRPEPPDQGGQPYRPRH